MAAYLATSRRRPVRSSRPCRTSCPGCSPRPQPYAAQRRPAGRAAAAHRPGLAARRAAGRQPAAGRAASPAPRSSTSPACCSPPGPPTRPAWSPCCCSWSPLLGWVFLDEHGEPVRQRLALAGPVSVVGVGALAAIATLPVGAALRAARAWSTPRSSRWSPSNPLTQLGAWANNPDAGAAAGARRRGAAAAGRPRRLRRHPVDLRHPLRAAVRSDGRTGLEPGPLPHATRPCRSQFAGLGGSWLPSPGTPLSVGLDDVLRRPDHRHPLLPRRHRRASSTRSPASYDDPPTEALDAAAGARARTSTRSPRLPPLPQPLADFAGQVGARRRDAVPAGRGDRGRCVRDEYKLSPTRHLRLGAVAPRAVPARRPRQARRRRRHLRAVRLAPSPCSPATTGCRPGSWWGSGPAGPGRRHPRRSAARTPSPGPRSTSTTSAGCRSPPPPTTTPSPGRGRSRPPSRCCPRRPTPARRSRPPRHRPRRARSPAPTTRRRPAAAATGSRPAPPPVLLGGRRSAARRGRPGAARAPAAGCGHRRRGRGRRVGRGRRRAAPRPACAPPPTSPPTSSPPASTPASAPGRPRSPRRAELAAFGPGRAARRPSATALRTQVRAVRRGRAARDAAVAALVVAPRPAGAAPLTGSSRLPWRSSARSRRDVAAAAPGRSLMP